MNYWDYVQGNLPQSKNSGLNYLELHWMIERKVMYMLKFNFNGTPIIIVLMISIHGSALKLEFYVAKFIS